MPSSFSETTNSFITHGFSRAGDILAASLLMLSITGGVRWPRKSRQMATGQGPGCPKRPPLLPPLAWPLCPPAKQPSTLSGTKSPNLSVLCPPRAAASYPDQAVVWLQPKQSSCCGISGTRGPVREALCLCIPHTLLTPKRSFTGQGGPPHPQAGSPGPGTAAPKENVIPQQKGP